MRPGASDPASTTPANASPQPQARSDERLAPANDNGGRWTLDWRKPSLWASIFFTALAFGAVAKLIDLI